MISFARMPSSMATFVAGGMQSIAKRSCWIVVVRRVRIGFGAWRDRPAAPPGRARPIYRRQTDASTNFLDAKGSLQMKLGVHVGYWGLGMGPQDQLQVVQEAERLGYDSVWTAEAYGSDAATVLAWLAAGTSKIRLGSAIFQIP